MVKKLIKKPGEAGKHFHPDAALFIRKARSVEKVKAPMPDALKGDPLKVKGGVPIIGTNASLIRKPDNIPVGKVFCSWCKAVEDDKPFHVGKVKDESDHLMVRAMCPKCTNSFMLAPDIQELVLAGKCNVVMEKDIMQYCEQNFNTGLMERKGKPEPVFKSIE